MYALSRAVPTRELLTRHAPVLAASFAVAEVYYKFHSFMLECAAFLATWFVLDFVVETALVRWSRRRVASSAP